MFIRRKMAATENIGLMYQSDISRCFIILQSKLTLITENIKATFFRGQSIFI